MGLADGWIVLGRSLFVGGLLVGGFDIGTLFTVPVLGGGVGAAFGSHGGAATVAEVPAGRDVPALLAVPPVSGVVLEPAGGVLDEDVVAGGLFCEAGLLELPVAGLVGVHGATVFVVCPVVGWPWLPNVPPVTLPGLPATPGVPVEPAPGAVVAPG